MEMDRIIEFLEARLAEDEGLALALSGDGDPDAAEARRVERLLAECNAKRDTINYVQRLNNAGMPEFSADYLEKFLIIMASVYSGHPDHDERWV
ncbi:putative anti-sigma-YlaC factor YlaD [Arthrobacter sp. UYP6]|uniref:DUF6221 family protein n=1 Tax=Arthrobacter sp. UYP6 TaxID=1756378 RepID=UPI0033957ADE